MKTKLLKMKRVKIFVLFIALFGTALLSQAQDVQDKPRVNWGVKVGTQYNYKLMHNTVALTLEYKESVFFIGPEHTRFFNNYYELGERYDRNALGLTFGYKYTLKTMAKTSFYLQTAFSVFPAKYSFYQMGLADWVQHIEWVIQNTASVGIRYKLGKNVSFLLDGGFGSLKGFFLLMDSFVPMASFSIWFE